jgi:hypothetical protein
VWVTILISTNVGEGEFSARACLRPLHIARCLPCTPLLIFALTALLSFGKLGRADLFCVAAIEKFFNQVGTHLLRTDNLVLNSSLELNDGLGTSGV